MNAQAARVFASLFKLHGKPVGAGAGLDPR